MHTFAGRTVREAKTRVATEYFQYLRKHIWSDHDFLYHTWELFKILDKASSTCLLTSGTKRTHLSYCA